MCKETQQFSHSLIAAILAATRLCENCCVSLHTCMGRYRLSTVQTSYVHTLCAIVSFQDIVLLIPKAHYVLPLPSTHPPSLPPTHPLTHTHTHTHA